MRYKDARKLVQGDKVVSKETGTTFTVEKIEAYGSVKTVRIYVKEQKECFLNDEVE